MALYEDKFCIIDQEGNLHLKTYFFPLGQEKVIPIEKIKAVYHQKQSWRQMLKVKNWGQGFSNVWWAHDIQRAFTNKYYNVIIQVEGEGTDKGFSVIDIDKFLQTLKSLLNADATVVDKLP